MPQTGMVGCDYKIFCVWEPGEGPPHMAGAGYGVMATLATDRETAGDGLEIFLSNE